MRSTGLVVPTAAPALAMTMMAPAARAHRMQHAVRRQMDHMEARIARLTRAMPVAAAAAMRAAPMPTAVSSPAAPAAAVTAAAETARMRAAVRTALAAKSGTMSARMSAMATRGL